MTIVARSYWLRSPLTDLPVQCSGSSNGEELHNLCMICLADTAMEGQQPGILKLDDEVEAYSLLGDGLPDCLPCEPRSWLHCMRCTTRIRRQHSAIRVQHQPTTAQHSASVQHFANI
jgi:hypothetical protein